jgi:hypothetical protein
VVAADALPQRSSRPQGARLSDADILEAIEALYEWACWASDLGMVDFDTFAELPRVIRELRARAEAAA